MGKLDVGIPIGCSFPLGDAEGLTHFKAILSR
jgi:hypothetical protein